MPVVDTGRSAAIRRDRGRPIFGSIRRNAIDGVSDRPYTSVRFGGQRLLGPEQIASLPEGGPPLPATRIGAAAPSPRRSHHRIMQLLLAGSVAAVGLAAYPVL